LVDGSDSFELETVLQYYLVFSAPAVSKFTFKNSLNPPHRTF